MDYISSVGLITDNLIELSSSLSVYTDIFVYEDFTQSVQLTFVSKESGQVVLSDFNLEESEIDSSISEETSDGEYITRVEIKLLGDSSVITYKEKTWTSVYYEDELYITQPSGVVLFYSEEFGFLKGEDLKRV